MMWLKSCPRCRGDLNEGSDIHAPYVACVQCGYYLSGDEEAGIRRSGALRIARGPAAAVAELGAAVG